MQTLLTVSQVAYILHVHPLTIRRYIKEQKLKAVRLGGNVRITEAQLQQFQKEITPMHAGSESIGMMRVKKLEAKSFSQDDPFLRLRGRGASLT